MPGFTSVTFQQSGIVQSQPLEEQLGGGVTNIVKGVGKTVKNTAKHIGSKANRIRDGFIPFEEAAKLYPKVINKGRRVADNGRKAIQAGNKAAVDSALNTIVDTAKTIGKSTKNKNIANIATRVAAAGTAGRIANSAAVTSRAARGGLTSKSLIKKLGKKALVAGVTAGVTAGAATTAHYINHIHDGGEAMSNKELGKIASEAGVDIIKNGLDGNLNKQRVRDAVYDAYNNIIRNKKGGKPIDRSSSMLKTLGRVARLMDKLNKIHARKHYKYIGESPLTLQGAKPFGSGAMGGGVCKRGRKGGRSKKGKSSRKGGCKKKTNRHKKHKKGGRSKSGRKGVLRVQDIFDVY